MSIDEKALVQEIQNAFGREPAPRRIRLFDKHVFDFDAPQVFEQGACANDIPAKHLKEYSEFVGSQRPEAIRFLLPAQMIAALTDLDEFDVGIEPLDRVLHDDAFLGQFVFTRQQLQCIENFVMWLDSLDEEGD